MRVIAAQAEESESNTAYVYSDIITEILYYIAKHCDEDLSLNLFPEKLGFPRNISSIFKKHEHYILNVPYQDRMDKVSFLLLSTSLNISEIAYACGFASETAMSEKFKKMYGMTPLQYKRASESKG